MIYLLLNTYQRSYQVHYYETNFMLEASPVTVLGYLEETATWHSETAGNSIASLNAAGRGWVVYRYHLQVSRYPRWQEKITVTTWVERFQRCFAYRNFYIHDAGGNLLGRAASVWIFLDIASKKPLRIPPAVSAPYGLYPEAAIPAGFSELPTLESPSITAEFTVGAADMDINHHANNKRYINWLLESVPLEVHRQAFPATIEIVYKKDARYGDHILSESQELKAGDGTRCYLHRLTCPKKELELALARTTWQER
ncbi:Acyl-ACP thioesterase [Moorella glycerini]|uniref:Acyl-ACP thioesterase n=2 Tax=Neomoorella TaxID=44260 RepID=A0A9X7J6N4_9FIRM|nr:acyl-ACP thioesterase domain-containing protein [Moorella mulderi]KYH33896.1 acyl-ACP thioesterase [Moorella mulderi DSM 14980]PRR77833.1 Acyl-ACP thioesterase [Moorella stamsii]CEP68942.1 Acyl-ACP thioesterase [Moorella glycerini]